MKKKKISTNFQHLNLIDFINIFWKEKFIFLSIFSIVLFSTFYYLNFIKSNEKDYTTELKLKDRIDGTMLKMELILGDFKNFGARDDDDDVDVIFYSIFRDNLISIDNLNQFFNKKKNIEDFKLYLEQNNIDPKVYFRNNFNLKDRFQKTNKLSLNFPIELKGDKFLNDYVKFVAEKTIEEYKQNLILFIDYTTKSYSRAFEIAMSIDLKEPIKRYIPENSATVNINHSEELFYMGTKVLELKMNHLLQIKNSINLLDFDFDPILDEASDPIELTYTNTRIYINAILMSILISLILVFIRNINKRN